MKLTDNEFIFIHKALHSWDPNTLKRTIEVRGVKYSLVLTPKSKCRSVLINGIKYIEQNKASTSDYATAARAGTGITWAIPLEIRGVPWGKIVNGVIESPIPGE